LKPSVVLLDLKEAFKISKLLGRGNFARVHLCNRIGDETKFYALKTMEKASIKKCRRNIVSFLLFNLLQNSVLLEIDVLRKMKHPNVIELYEVYESSKYIHLLLPYLEGGELFERIKAKGLYKESDAIKVMRNFISALKYLSEN